MQNDTVRLRGHHLLCILTYIGRGYTPKFTENMTAIIGRIDHGAKIEIVAGADDICAPMMHHDSHHCHNNDVIERDKVALITVSMALSRHVHIGNVLRLSGDDIQKLRRMFAQNSFIRHRNDRDICIPFRAACHECPWQGTCTEIADAEFKGTILSIPVMTI